MKRYKVLLPGFVDLNGNPAEVGSTISLDPENGNTKSGVYFKQLKLDVSKAKAKEAPAEAAPAEEANPSGTASKKPASKKPA